MEKDGLYFPDNMQIEEFEVDKETYSSKRFNKNVLMPAEPAAIFFIGPRGEGKTTAMLNLIHKFDYDTLSIFSSTLHQPKFKPFMDRKAQLEYMTGADLDNILMFEDDLSIILDGTFIKSREPGQHHLVIIDDFAVDKRITEGAFKQLVMNGRPAGITALMSSQNFMTLDNALRKNATHICFFRNIIPDDIKRIARMYIPDVKPAEFLTMYNYAMSRTDISQKPFLLYDKMTNIPEERFRIGFDYLFVRRKN